MKKLLIAAGVAVSAAFALAGCGTPAQITPDQLKQAINNVATVTAAGCTVVQPTLVAGAAVSANPVAGVAAGVNGVFCAAQTPLITATAPATAPVAAPANAPVAASAPVVQ